MLNPIIQALFQSAQQLYEKRERSGSVPLTNGSASGSWRPKNMRILLIRIPSTACSIIQFINQSKGFYFLFRNVKPAFQKLGLYGGLAYTGLFYILARGKEPWTFKHGVSPLTIGLCLGSGSGSIEGDQKTIFSSFQECIFVRN